MALFVSPVYPLVGAVLAAELGAPVAHCQVSSRSLRRRTFVSGATQTHFNGPQLLRRTCIFGTRRSLHRVPAPQLRHDVALPSSEAIAMSSGPAAAGDDTVTAAAVRDHRAAESVELGTPTLIMYTRHGCCLCGMLFEQLLELYEENLNLPLLQYVLELRDIDTDPEWHQAYQYEVPVLVKSFPGRSPPDLELPRVSPRFSAAEFHQFLSKYFTTLAS